jgi:hypothetical protein
MGGIRWTCVAENQSWLYHGENLVRSSFGARKRIERTGSLKNPVVAYVDSVPQAMPPMFLNVSSGNLFRQ